MGCQQSVLVEILRLMRSTLWLPFVWNYEISHSIITFLNLSGKDAEAYFGALGNEVSSGFSCLKACYATLVYSKVSRLTIYMVYK